MEEAIEYARDLVVRAGLPRARVVIVDCACDKAEEMEAALAQASCIWVLGGNTFYLWHHMQHSGLDAIVRERVRRGAGAQMIGEVAWSPRRRAQRSRFGTAEERERVRRCDPH